MPRILAENLAVEFPIVAQSARSLRNVAMRAASAIGGRVVDSTNHVRLVKSLDNINIDLKDGDRLGLMGPNGSGKTTLIRTLSGIYHATGGSLHIEGKRFPMFDINVGVDEEATGFENIHLRGLIMGLSSKEIAERTEYIAEYSELGSYLDMPMRTYSSGMILRLMFAIATSIEGDIVLMDEWLSVGDESFRIKANVRLKEITRKSGILVLASHDMNLLRETCNLGMYLENGQVKHFGPIGEVLDLVHPPEVTAA